MCFNRRFEQCVQFSRCGRTNVIKLIDEFHEHVYFYQIHLFTHIMFYHVTNRICSMIGRLNNCHIFKCLKIKFLLNLIAIYSIHVIETDRNCVNSCILYDIYFEEKVQIQGYKITLRQKCMQQAINLLKIYCISLIRRKSNLRLDFCFENILFQ